MFLEFRLVDLKQGIKIAAADQQVLCKAVEASR